MSDKGKNMLFGLAIVGLVAFFLLKQSVRIDVGTPSVSFLQATGNGLRIIVKLPLLNRSDLTYPIEGFLGQLYFQGSALGTVMLKQPVKVPARSSGAPEFVAEISWGSLGTQAYDLLDQTGVVDWLAKKIGLPTGSNTPATKPINWTDFKIKGTLYVGGVAVDIDQKLA